MKSYLLDTSVIIDYLRGKEQAVELLNNIQGELSSSYFCVSELYEGVYRAREKERVEESVKTFFHSLSGIYTLDDSVAQKFGELRARLKKQGNVIEDIDLFIAATCLVYGLTLITYNKRHFSHIEELLLF